MSIVTIHVPEEQEEVFVNFLKSVPYITVEREQKKPTPKSDWRALEGKYAASGITAKTLSRNNDEEKERERNQKLQ